MNWIFKLYTFVPHLMSRHLLISGILAGLVMILVGVIVIFGRKPAGTVEAAPEGGVRGSDGRLHVLWAGYDGEGVYAWSCFCGAAQSDYQGLDDATIFGTVHLDDVDAIVAA